MSAMSTTAPLPLVRRAETDDEDERAAPEAELLAHDYDGIREYDNPLPGWWRAVFYGSIVFAIGYGVALHGLGWIRTPAEAYDQALVAYGTHKAMSAPTGPQANEGLLANGAHDGDTRERGAAIFAARCAGCHLPDGRGQIGPNLTDGFQIHGTTRMDIYETINGGVTGTAMPAWGEQLSGADVISVAAYVSTLRGTNVPNGKAPQGQPVKAFE